MSGPFFIALKDSVLHKLNGEQNFPLLHASGIFPLRLGVPELALSELGIFRQGLSLA